jgi:hypothetical protein
LSSFRPPSSPLPNPQPTSSQSVGAPLHTESQDSERTSSEATVGEAMAQADEAIMELPNPTVTVTMAEKPTSASALVVVSSA